MTGSVDRLDRVDPTPGLRPLVLVVEDEPLNRRLVHAVLEPAGYDVVEASTLADARSWLEDGRPDLILLDLRLPDGDGLILAREMKSRPELSVIPIVAATASALAPVPEAAIDAGCDGFLVKPIRPSELLAEVARQLERTPARPTPRDARSEAGAGGP